MSESTSLLATKLYLPRPRPNLVRRPRLLARLNTGLQRKLTLIAAPAGFGKTTLLSSWIFERYGTSPETGSIQNPRSPLDPKIQNGVAWLSLDEGDGDPTRFLRYLVAAIQTIAPHIGAGVMTVLQSPQPPLEASGREAMLTALLNEITTLPAPFVLVLDDYHVIDGGGGARVQGTPAGFPLGRDGTGAVDQMLTFLVEHLPPQMHLVISTREDPSLPLTRLRARGQLTELRAADLRFTPAEAADFLNGVMGLSLSAQDVATLEERTEGWIAGLQLAALSLQDNQDVPNFIRTFAGEHRYILDYLVEEVLQRQPERVRNFLLQSAILDGLHGPLCDAVTGQEGGSARLDALHRGNFFVVPLDNTRQWYRYHHLFAEVLRAHLLVEQPDQVSTLHRRASMWYEQHGSAADAIRHALAAKDFTRAAVLVELAIPVMHRNRQEATLLGWLQALPDELIRYRPVLSVHYAGTLLQCGVLAGVETRLQDAERCLSTGLDTEADMREQPPTTDSRPSAAASPKSFAPERHPAQEKHRRRKVVVDGAEFRRLPGWLANYRAAHALIRGNVYDTLAYARQALDLMPDDEHFGRGAAAALLGLAAWTSGDLEAAYQSYAEGMAHLQQAGHIADAIGGAIALADIRVTQGRLREAMRIYERGLQLAIEQHPEGSRPVLRGTADMYVGMSELHLERNDLKLATQYLMKSKEQGEHTGFPQNPYRWRVAMARIKEAEGDLDGALALLQEAERLYVSDFYPNVRPVAALKTRVWLAQGRVEEALDWAREQGLSAHDDLSYLCEFEHITLARVFLAQYKSERADCSLHEAIGLLNRLLEAAKAGGRTGRVIEILVLQALAHQLQGDSSAALLPLEHALTLAGGPMGAEGYIRLFVNEGPPLRLLLTQWAQSAIVDFRFSHPEGTRQQPATEQNRKLSVYVDKLLAAFGNEQANAGESLIAEPAKIQNPAQRAPAKIQNLVEPLSQRELEVLRLFKTELSGPEIAQQLVIGLSTVRTHTKRIFSKLNVTNRRAAVKRATELHLL